MAQGLGDSASDSTRGQYASLVERFGYASASCQTQSDRYKLWWSPDRQACIPYVDTGKAWLAAGEPLGPLEMQSQLAEQFRLAAVKLGRRVAFFGVERPWFEEQGATEIGGNSWRQLTLGLQPVIEPERWPQVLRKTRSLREQLRRARSHGVTVKQVSGYDIEGLVNRWRASKAMPPMGFLVALQLESLRPEQRLYVALCEERCVGISLAVRLPARKGWLLEHLLRAPGSPNGTTESLVHALIQDAAMVGDQFVTLGLAPLAGDIGPLLSWFRKRGAPLYDFAGLEHFKAKFRPQRWEVVSLCYPASQSAAISIYDSLCAFAGSGLTSYAVRTVFRGPQIVLRGLAFMLLPWILVLILCDAEHWFSSEWQRQFWVVFDIGVAGSLWALSKRFVGKRASVLSWLVLFDALATLGLATFYNVPRIEGWLEGFVLAMAVGAPWLAWGVLRGAIVRGT